MNDVTEVVDLIDVGWAVWERVPDLADYPPKGGTVVDVRGDDTYRTFVVVDSPHGRIRFFTLGQDEIAHAELPNATIIRSRARQMEAEASRNKGAADSFELKLTRYALRLKELVA